MLYIPNPLKVEAKTSIKDVFDWIEESKYIIVTEHGLQRVPVELFTEVKGFYYSYNHTICIDRTDGLAEYDLSVLVESFNANYGTKLTLKQFKIMALATPEQITEE